MCDQVNLADDAVDARTLVRLNHEMRSKMIETHFCELTLEVVGLVPLYNGVLYFADTAQVTVNLHDAVWVLVVSIFVVIENVFLRGLAKLWFEPLKAG